jgi:osmotically inducible protein OsmC
MRPCAANTMKIRLPADLAVDAEVDLVQDRRGPISSRPASTSACRASSATSPRPWSEAAHQTCPYSKATRGNIDVALNVI